MALLSIIAFLSHSTGVSMLLELEGQSIIGLINFCWGILFWRSYLVPAESIDKIIIPDFLILLMTKYFCEGEENEEQIKCRQ